MSGKQGKEKVWIVEPDLVSTDCISLFGPSSQMTLAEIPHSKGRTEVIWYLETT